MKLLRNNLLIRRDNPEERTQGGIILAQSAQKKPHRGTVVAAGAGRFTEHGHFVSTEVLKGDVVIFPAELGHEITIDGETLLMIAEDLVIAIVEPADASTP